MNYASTPIKTYYIESYGCQMNFSDSEIVASILSEKGFQKANQIEDANLILLNTCSIREKAEQTIRHRLQHIKGFKQKNKAKIGILGCMAERLKTKLLEQEKMVDIIAGPDAYRDLPKLVEQAFEGDTAVNVVLSKEETYADISPVKLNANGVTAFVTIMRGCDNMCTFCVVPYTRGRERSRDPQSILEECQNLYQQGYREVTLLGQNVDSYLWFGGKAKKDFNKANILEQSTAIHFAGLLDLVARKLPNMRIRFSTSNPQDMVNEVLHTMKKHPNICKNIHLPVQSGNTRILALMKRGYTREEYLERVKAIRDILPQCTITHDIIAGFCSETEAEHRDTLSLMEEVRYATGFMFAYSERDGTPAARKMEDDVPEKVKKERLNEIIQLQHQHSKTLFSSWVGQEAIVLVEGTSKRNPNELQGRNDQNITTVFAKENYQKGDYVKVKITDYTTTTLKAKPMGQITTLI